MALFTKEEALNYHSTWRTGKLEVVPIKPCRNQKDLSLAYSPGVAVPVRTVLLMTGHAVAGGPVDAAVVRWSRAAS